MVIVISESIQEFNGERYYRCGKYFQRSGRRLHIAVWEDANGPVPAGHHIHHRDNDRAHNQLTNLQLKEARLHISDHQRGHRRALSEAALEAAALWHRSDQGRTWHREHYERTAGCLHVDADMDCAHCGKRFSGRVNGLTRFCSNNCKTKARKASGVDDESRRCVHCGGAFTINKYASTKTCSRKCAAALRVGERRGR